MGPCLTCVADNTRQIDAWPRASLSERTYDLGIRAMLTLRDIMTKDVVCVSPDTAIAEVVALLRTEGITGVPVMAQGRVLGVISASDILEFTQREPESLDQPVVSNWDDPDIVAEREIELESGFADIEEAEEEPLPEDFDELEEDLELFDAYTAADIMTRKLCALPSSTSLAAAARQMVRAAVHRLLVIDSGRLVGIATSMDFMRAVADGRLAQRRNEETKERSNETTKH